MLEGFVTAEISTRAVPNEGTWHSVRNALVSWLAVGLLFGLGTGLIVWLGTGLYGGLFSGLGVRWFDTKPIDVLRWSWPGFSRSNPVLGLIVGLLGGLDIGIVATADKGALFFLQHWGLRILLWRYGYAPFQYVRFLDYAAERIFLRKVGSGYIFVNRRLMEYFASLGPSTTLTLRAGEKVAGGSEPWAAMRI